MILKFYTKAKGIMITMIYAQHTVNNNIFIYHDSSAINQEEINMKLKTFQSSSHQPLAFSW